MGCIFAILTCIYKDFDLQQVFEASPPKNHIFNVTSYVVFQKYHDLKVCSICGKLFTSTILHSR